MAVSEEKALSETLRKNTPAEQMFSTASLTQAEEGLHLHLNVPAGVPEDFQGIVSIEDQGTNKLIVLADDHSDGVINTINDSGIYGQLHVRKMNVSIDDITNGQRRPVPDNIENQGVFSDDIYLAFLNILRLVHFTKDFTVQDAIAQSGCIVIIRRANGDFDIGLYRRHNSDGVLEHLGQILIDNKMRYEVTGRIKEPDYKEERDALSVELKNISNTIEAKILEINNIKSKYSNDPDRILPALEPGNSGHAEEKTNDQVRKDFDDDTIRQIEAQINEETQRFHKFLERAGMVNEFEWFIVTETIDYSSAHWMKFSDENGIDIASQAVNYKTMSSIVESEAAKTIANTDLKILERSIRSFSPQTSQDTDDPHSKFSLTSLYHAQAYLKNTIRTYFTEQAPRPRGSMLPRITYNTIGNDADTTIHCVYENNSSNYVTTENTLEQTLDKIQDLQKNAKFINRYVVPKDQRDEMHRLLAKSGWIAWLKSFIAAEAYENSNDATTLRNIIGNASFNDLFLEGKNNNYIVAILNHDSVDPSVVLLNDSNSSSELQTVGRDLLSKGEILIVEQQIDDVNKINKNKFLMSPTVNKVNKELYSKHINEHFLTEELDKEKTVLIDQIKKAQADKGYVQRAGHFFLGTATAASSGMITGYAVQRGVDMISTYYNSGLAPWDYSHKESGQQHERAVRTGAMAAVTSTASYWALPHVANYRGYFERTTGSAFGGGLKGKYDATIAGGLAGVATKSMMSGYRYWKGEISGNDFAHEFVHSAARAVPVSIGSAVGHTLLPYAVNVPILSNILPMRYMGAVLGSVAGSAVYDTATHYGKKGYQKLSEYAYGSDKSAK